MTQWMTQSSDGQLGEPGKCDAVADLIMNQVIDSTAIFPNKDSTDEPNDPEKYEAIDDLVLNQAENSTVTTAIVDEMNQ